MKYKGLHSVKRPDFNGLFSYITINTQDVEKYPGGNHRIVSIFWKGEKVFGDERGYANVNWFII